MATNNPFKAFIPYTVSPQVFDSTVVDKLEARQATDPTAGTWRTLGFNEPLRGEGYVVDLQGAAQWLSVQFNERILPGKVRDEHLSKVVTKLEGQTGRKVSKKEYAQLRDQVEFDLLPRAFIRRTAVAVVFTGNWMFVFTSSQKRADEIVALLMGTFGEELKPVQMQTAERVPVVLTDLAIGGSDLYRHRFRCLNAAVLKGDAKKSIRIKDKDIADQDVQDLLDDYEVIELAMSYGDDADAPDLELTVKDGFHFKRLALPDVKVTPLKEDAFGFALLCVQTYKRMLRDFLAACGGLEKPIVPAASSDEDDDL